MHLKMLFSQKTNGFNIINHAFKHNDMTQQFHKLNTYLN